MATDPSQGAIVKSPIPFDEVARLEALHRYDLSLDQADPDFHRLVALAASVCRAPFAWLGFLDRDRVWLKSAIGVTQRYVPRRRSFGAYMVNRADELLVVNDADRDWRFANSPLVTGEPRLRFYAAAPLVESSGHVIGMVAIADVVARGLSDPERELLHTLAREVVVLLELRQTGRRLECELAERAQYERRSAAIQRQLQATNALLGAASLSDSLTGVANRRAFDQHLEAEIDRVSRFHYPLSLLMIDIDRFKQINDVFGHPAGDQVIRRVAELIGHSARTTDFVARIGGDEFAVILPRTDGHGAKVIGERCRAAIERACWPRMQVRISVGVGQLAPGASNSSELIAAADQSLMRAKHEGRNLVMVTPLPDKQDSKRSPRDTKPVEMASFFETAQQGLRHPDNFPRLAFSRAEPQGDAAVGDDGLHRASADKG
jgi:diguanylate cyclase (GGDEF)-like protein